MRPFPVLVDDVVSEEPRQDREGLDGAVSAQDLDARVHRLVGEQRGDQLVEVHAHTKERGVLLRDRPGIHRLEQWASQRVEAMDPAASARMPASVSFTVEN